MSFVYKDSGATQSSITFHIWNSLISEMVRLEFFLTITCAAVVSSVVLKVPGYATIEGTQSTSAYNQRKYFSFHNLPYAKQPTNLTRFMVIFF